MSVQRIAQVIAEAPGTLPVMYGWVQGTACEGSKFHSPRPLLVLPHDLRNHVGLALQEPAPSESENVYLCGTCADNLTLYLAILLAYDGETPGSVRKDFGNTIRYLGDRAWAYHIKRSGSLPV